MHFYTVSFKTFWFYFGHFRYIQKNKNEIFGWQQTIIISGAFFTEIQTYKKIQLATNSPNMFLILILECSFRRVKQISRVSIFFCIEYTLQTNVFASKVFQKRCSKISFHLPDAYKKILRNSSDDHETIQER